MTQKSIYSEEALVSGIKAGNLTIIEYIYKQYFPMVAHFVRSNSGSENDAEDIYQDGLALVCKKIKDGENIQYLKTYVYSVCRLKWLEQLRLRKRRGENIVENYEHIFIRIEEDEASKAPYVEAMGKALDELDEKCRELLVTFYGEKLTMEEIASRFGYNTANSAKSKKNKCMDRLREKAKMILKKLNN